MSKNLHHHANLLIASPEEAETYLHQFCDGLGITLANNPDFFVFKTETFGIDEARELRLLAVRKSLTTTTGGLPAQAGKKIFLITPTLLTPEAQNALLKTFEDPFPDTLFFLAVREEGFVVPTLRSRMQTVRVPKGTKSQYKKAEEFLSLSLKNRLIFAKKFALEEKNLSIFLDALLLLLRKKDGTKKSLENVYRFSNLVSNTTLAPRLIIEHLSLVL